MGSEKMKSLGNWPKLGLIFNRENIPLYIFFALVTGLITVEVCFFLPDSSWIKNIFGWYWVLISYVTLVCILVRTFSFFSESSYRGSDNKGIFLLAFLFPALLLSFNITGITYTHVDTESIAQQEESLSKIAYPGGGVFRLAFLGDTYPNRQYMLITYPSLFCRGLWEYRLGYMILYLLGYWTLLVSCARYLYFKKCDLCLVLTGLMGAMISLGDYVVCVSRLYEQIGMPISVTMLILGGFLTFFVEGSYFSRFWIIWNLGLLPYCYTPAIAGWFLSLCIIGYFCYQKTAKGRAGFSILATSVMFCYGLLSLGVSRVMISVLALEPRIAQTEGLQIGSPDNFDGLDWTWRFFSGFRALLGQQQSMFPAPLVIFSIAMLGVSYWKRDVRFPLAFLWALSCTVGALTFEGWCWRLPETDIVRSSLIVPVVSLGAMLCFSIHVLPHLDERAKNLFRWTSYTVIAYMVFTSSFIPFAERDVRDVSGPEMTNSDECMALLDSLKSSINPNSIQRLYEVPPLDENVGPVAEYLFGHYIEVIRKKPLKTENMEGCYVIYYIDPAHSYFDIQYVSKNPHPHLKLVPVSRYLEQNP